MTWTPGSSEAALLAESLSLASIQIWGGVCSMCTILSLFFRMSLVAYRTGNTAGPQQEPTGYVHVYPYAHIKKGIMVSVCEGGSLSNLPHPPSPCPQGTLLLLPEGPLPGRIFHEELFGSVLPALQDEPDVLPGFTSVARFYDDLIGCKGGGGRG